MEFINSKEGGTTLEEIKEHFKWDNDELAYYNIKYFSPIRANKYFFRQRIKIDKNKSKEVWRVSDEGEDYLKNEEINKGSRILTRLVAIATVAALILNCSSYLHSMQVDSSKIIGPIPKCPNEIKNIEKLQFTKGNYGKVPETVNIEFYGDGIESKPLFSPGDMEKNYQENFGFSIVIPQIEYEKSQTNFEFELKVNKRLKNNISFVLTSYIGEGLEAKLNKVLFRDTLICEFLRIENTTKYILKNGKFKEFYYNIEKK